MYFSVMNFFKFRIRPPMDSNMEWRIEEGKRQLAKEYFLCCLSMNYITTRFFYFSFIVLLRSVQ